MDEFKEYGGLVLTVKLLVLLAIGLIAWYIFS
jgi:hypothetical protein